MEKETEPEEEKELELEPYVRHCSICGEEEKSGEEFITGHLARFGRNEEESISPSLPILQHELTAGYDAGDLNFSFVSLHEKCYAAQLDQVEREGGPRQRELFERLFRFYEGYFKETYREFGFDNFDLRHTIDSRRVCFGKNFEDKYVVTCHDQIGLFYDIYEFPDDLSKESIDFISSVLGSLVDDITHEATNIYLSAKLRELHTKDPNIISYMSYSNFLRQKISETFNDLNMTGEVPTMAEAIEEIDLLYDLAHSSTYRDLLALPPTGAPLPPDAAVLSFNEKEVGITHAFTISRLMAMIHCAKMIQRNYPECLDLKFGETNGVFDLVACEIFPSSHEIIRQRTHGMYEIMVNKPYKLFPLNQEFKLRHEIGGRAYDPFTPDRETVSKMYSNSVVAIEYGSKSTDNNFDIDIKSVEKSLTTEQMCRIMLTQYISLVPVDKKLDYARKGTWGAVIRDPQDFLNMTYNILNVFPLENTNHHHQVGFCDCCLHASLLPGETLGEKWPLRSMKPDETLLVEAVAFEQQGWTNNYDEWTFKPKLLCHKDCLNNYFLSDTILGKQVLNNIEVDAWRKNPEYRIKELECLEKAVKEKFGHKAPCFDWNRLKTLKEALKKKIEKDDSNELRKPGFER